MGEESMKSDMRICRCCSALVRSVDSVSILLVGGRASFRDLGPFCFGVGVELDGTERDPLTGVAPLPCPLMAAAAVVSTLSLFDGMAFSSSELFGAPRFLVDMGREDGTCGGPMEGDCCCKVVLEEEEGWVSGLLAVDEADRG